LRYYEKVGIIPTPARTQAGYRIYSEADLARLKFIKKAKDLGFSLREISSIFQLLSSDKNITNQLFGDQVSAKITEIDQKINAYDESISRTVDLSLYRL
jgi:Predicted transcriptional regulators